MASEPSVEAVESAPDEVVPEAAVAPESSATDEHLPTPADAESGADPEIDGPDEGVVNGDDDR